MGERGSPNPPAGVPPYSRPRSAAGGPARVLGLDPGSLRTGWGVVQAGPQGRDLTLVAAGVIAVPPRDDFASRLQGIHQQLQELIAQHQPTEAAVEGVFTAKNARTALLLGQARGVALLAAAQAGLSVFEYPPAAVKKALVGTGRADKEQVRTMVGALLKDGRHLALDASDALALAITHLHSRQLRQKGLK